MNSKGGPLNAGLRASIARPNLERASSLKSGTSLSSSGFSYPFKNAILSGLIFGMSNSAKLGAGMPKMVEGICTFPAPVLAVVVFVDVLMDPSGAVFLISTVVMMVPSGRVSTIVLVIVPSESVRVVVRMLLPGGGFWPALTVAGAVAVVVPQLAGCSGGFAMAGSGLLVRFVDDRPSVDNLGNLTEGTRRVEGIFDGASFTSLMTFLKKLISGKGY